MKKLEILLGTYTGYYSKPAVGKFSAQIVVQITKASCGTSTITKDKDKNNISDIKLKEVGDIYVGIKEDNKFLPPRVKNLKDGDIIGLCFIEEVPTDVWLHDAKSINLFVKWVDKEYLENKISEVFDDSVLK